MIKVNQIANRVLQENGGEKTIFNVVNGGDTFVNGVSAYQGRSTRVSNGTRVARTENVGHLGDMDHPRNAGRLYGSFAAGPVSQIPMPGTAPPMAIAP